MSKILGTKFDLRKSSDLPKVGPYLIISNHQSMFDIPILYTCLSDLSPRFVSKIELGKWIPGVSTCLKLSKAALIDRSNPSQAIAEISRFGKFIKEIKGGAAIFPEGTRARDGAIKSFKRKGAISLAKECLPCWIVPLAIEGSWNLQQRKFGPIPLNIKIAAESLTPIYITEDSDINQILIQVEELIGNKIIELRSIENSTNS